MTANHAHTPTWDRVREHYYLGRQQFDDPLFPAAGVTEIVAEFDRWYQAEIAAAEQRGAEKGLRRAEKLLKEDRLELGETVSVQLIIDWLRLLAGQSINNHRDQETTMADLPGYYMTHCTNCMASTHSAQNCPYNEEEEDA